MSGLSPRHFRISDFSTGLSLGLCKHQKLHSIFLSLAERPVAVVRWENITTLTCTSFGYPAPRIIWYQCFGIRPTWVAKFRMERVHNACYSATFCLNCEHVTGLQVQRTWGRAADGHPSPSSHSGGAERGVRGCGGGERSYCGAVQSQNDGWVCGLQPRWHQQRYIYCGGFW